MRNSTLLVDLQASASARAREVLAAQLPALVAAARGLCRDGEKVDDLVQDTFEKALRSIDTVDLDRNPRSWMIAILYNLHIDRCRQLARRQPHIPCDEVALATPDDHDARGADDAPAWSSLTADDVRRAAAQLPMELRDTYQLFAFEGRSYSEIAAQLGIAKGTVGTRILRARAQLKKLLVADLREEAP